MNSGFKADGDLRRELLVRLIEGEESIDDHVGFTAATVHFSGDNDYVFRANHFLIPRIVFGPRNAANDSGGVFEVEIGVPRMSVAAGFFGGCQLD